MKVPNRLQRAVLAAAVVVLCLTACTGETGEGGPADSTAVPVPSEPATGPVAVDFAGEGEGIGGDMSELPGFADRGQCAVAANLRTLCHWSGGSAGSTLTFDGIFTYDQFRNPVSLDESPPAVVGGLSPEARILLAEPTSAGFVLVYSEQYGGPHTILLTDFEGAQVWSTPAPARVVDLAVTATHILVSTDEGVVEMDQATGTSRDAAPAGTTLLGYKNPLSAHATYLPDQRGLAEADGGQLVDPRPLVLRMLDSCSDDAVCSVPSVLLADREHALISVSTGDISTGGQEGTLTAFTSDGDSAWTLPGTPNSAVRFQDTYVLGFDGDAAGPARLIAVNAQTGEKIGESLFSGDKAMILGAVEQGILVRYAAVLGGPYDSMQTVLSVTVTEGELPVREEPSSWAGSRTAGSGASAAASASASASATAPGLSGADLAPGWSTYEAEDDPISLDLPPDWSVEFVPGDGGPRGNQYVFRDGNGVESAELTANMSGLGGMCGNAPPWPVSEHRIALPHMNRAATAIAKESLYLETVEDELGGLSHRVTDLLAHPGICPMYKLSEPGGGLGTTNFSGQITASEKDQPKAAELRALMLSFRVEQ